MRAALFTLCWLLVRLCAAQIPSLPPGPNWQFALTLGATSDGQLFTPFLVKLGAEGQVLETQAISRAQFFKQAQGRMFSKANAEGEDLFRKYGVAQCTLSPDSAAMGYWLQDCSTLDDLWRLRFQSFPHRLEEGMHEMLGWAGKPLKPDERQMFLLEGYGMKHPLDLVVGEHLFRLLKDMGDPEWVDNYRKGL